MYLDVFYKQEDVTFAMLVVVGAFADITMIILYCYACGIHMRLFKKCENGSNES